ncbi:uncharacterized protein GLRG_02101 [Colletotrichum graminicola M1.001]|uniref:Uncharacterized protein n=1 Tax=Colletotrichum graminicola (strain M1.001 / M2 / FGSC 10212) TaxID=645133 RepID=E3Q7R8_COLGM|nr:uncharacterized protein GLRG_02101 [Colletotrichum graminicola M1.001]EFQ26930.1 hypothetical protein GLRG_02101 [Colletotrichum graminicola M1.001]
MVLVMANTTKIRWNYCRVVGCHRPLQETEPSTLLPNTSPVFGHKHPTQDSIPVRYWEFPRTLPHAGTTSTLFLPVDMRLIPGQPLNHPCSISFPHDFPAIIPPKKPPA